ncbi:MAG TPA: hypothetical protein VMG40_21825 [Bryobacteraceae bacterium]|nr:hypothetical protein [Bryobacteraceae bacterium]
MTTARTIEFKAQRTVFFSQLDEDSFFGWLEKLPCVSGFQGRGDVLLIRVLQSRVDEGALRDLLALFYRYRIEMGQLAVFDKPEFAHWFHKKSAYWYKRVFGSGAVNPPRGSGRRKRVVMVTSGI